MNINRLEHIIDEEVRKVLEDSLVSDVESFITKRISDTEVLMKKTSQAYKDLIAFYEEKAKTFTKFSSRIEIFLKENGFEIENTQFVGKTGIKGDHTDLRPDDQLLINGTLKMVGEMKTSQEDKRNEQIAKRIKEKFIKEFPEMSIQINSNSLNHNTGILYKMFIR